MADLLIRGARQLLTLRGPSGPRRGAALSELALIPDGALLIRNGLIEDVGPSRRIENLASARGASEIDATGRVVMPLFVDLEAALVHARPAARTFETLSNNHGDNGDGCLRAALEEGAKSLTELSSRNLRQRAEILTRNLLRQGTGTIEARAGYPVGETGTLKVLRVQAELTNDIDVISTLQLAPDRRDVEAWVCECEQEILPAVARRRMARFVDLEYDPAVLPYASARRLLSLSAAFKFGLKVHAGLFSAISAISLALEYGVRSIGNILEASTPEMDCLAGSGIIVVVTPGMALHGSVRSTAPAREMIDRGVPIAVSSGYHAELNPAYNMHLVLLLASKLCRVRLEEAISASTINPAHAAGVAASVGSLEIHKQADVQILNISDYRELPYLAGRAGGVHTVLKRGEVVYEDSGMRSQLQ